MNDQLVTLGTTQTGKLQLDIARLIDSRMLIQANSGGGKSWLLRLIAERASRHIPVIVIDYEGEFASLRETVDLVLVGSQGEIPADTRSAGLLARKLVELEVSAVLDIYELKPHDRRMYVKAFLESLLALPRSLWKPMLIMIDEAHKLAPQTGSQKDCASTQAVIDLMSMGGKRGFCGILATQRFSKIHNDAIAEANNVMIGRTWLSADQARAAEYLGLTTKTERTELRSIEQGHFYAFGPALQPSDVTLVHSDKVKTTHPRGTTRLNYAPPVASKAVQEIVSKLSDLPQQAEAEARSLEEAQRKIKTLERELRSQKPVIDETAIEQAEQRGYARAMADIKQLQIVITERNKRLNTIAEIAHLNGDAMPVLSVPERVAVTRTVATVMRPARSVQPAKPRTPSASGEKLPQGERQILTVAAQYPQGATREQMSILTGYKRSTRDAYVKRLRDRGYIDDDLLATAEGIAALGDFQPLPTGEDLRNYWLARLPESERKVLEILIQHYPAAIQREVVDEFTDYARSSRDAYLQRLGARRLVDSVGRGEVRASAVLFD